MPIKIAIIGGGLAGLATAYFLQKKGEVSITLFDRSPIGKNTSGAAPGLLHPYPGLEAKQSPHAAQAMDLTSELLEAASRGLSSSHPVYSPSGILRLAQSKRQYDAFQKTASYPDVVFYSPEACQKKCPGILSPFGGLWIPEGITVNTPLYLQGLWQAIQQRSHSPSFLPPLHPDSIPPFSIPSFFIPSFFIQRVQQSISDLKTLTNFDAIVVTTGASSSPSLPIPPSFTPVKGQALTLVWPEALPPPTCAVIGRKYLTPPLRSDRHLVTRAGATYEYNSQSAAPDKEQAKSILSDLATFYPPLGEAKILKIDVGIRAVPPDRRTPILEQIDKKTWLFTGLGSRGLLLHAFYAEKLATLLLNGR